ncbi:MAG: hypothetical protein MI723_04725 [Caulobacterales bacterium]|nr:hypothetical protein [Caulobacterales bacterium]
MNGADGWDELDDEMLAFELRLALLGVKGLSAAANARAPDRREALFRALTPLLARRLRRAGLRVFRRRGAEGVGHGTPG